MCALCCEGACHMHAIVVYTSSLLVRVFDDIMLVYVDCYSSIALK